MKKPNSQFLLSCGENIIDKIRRTDTKTKHEVNKRKKRREAKTMKLLSHLIVSGEQKSGMNLKVTEHTQS